MSAIPKAVLARATDAAGRVKLADAWRAAGRPGRDPKSDPRAGDVLVKPVWGKVPERRVMVPGGRFVHTGLGDKLLAWTDWAVGAQVIAISPEGLRG